MRKCLLAHKSQDIVSSRTILPRHGQEEPQEYRASAPDTETPRSDCHAFSDRDKVVVTVGRRFSPLGPEYFPHLAERISTNFSTNETAQSHRCQGWRSPCPPRPGWSQASYWHRFPTFGPQILGCDSGYPWRAHGWISSVPLVVFLGLFLCCLRTEYLMPADAIMGFLSSSFAFKSTYSPNLQFGLCGFGERFISWTRIRDIGPIVGRSNLQSLEI